MINRATLFIAMIMILSPFCRAAWAEHPDTQTEIANLKKRIEQLEKHDVDHPQQAFSLINGQSSLSITGLVEMEGSYEKTEGGDDSSDLTLATVELGVEASLNEQAHAHVLMLWEDGEHGVTIDEAVISLTAPQPILNHELTLHAGRLYLPFGNFNTNMISDGLTLNLAETRDSALLLEFHGDKVTCKLALFNGDTDSDDNNDHVDSWVAAIEFHPLPALTLGASYINDLAESDIELVGDSSLYRHDVPAAGAYVNLAVGEWSFDAEIISALRHFDATTVAGGEDLSGDQPCAWTIELGWQPTRDLLLATRYEQAEDFQDDTVRYGLTASYAIFDQVMLAVEYLHSDSKGDEGVPTHIGTAQLALSF